jgi:hypothetical protein
VTQACKKEKEKEENGIIKLKLDLIGTHFSVFWDSI